MTAFASLVQDYLISHGALAEGEAGRMIALLGDAELDEGNIYECLIEGYKHDVRNCWWIVDYNRQSLDAMTADRMFGRFDDIFRTCGWRVVTLKHGVLQRVAFARPGGAALEHWIDNCSNAEFAALTYHGGEAWRERLLGDVGDVPGIRELVDSYDDAALARMMTNLRGHCAASLIEAFAAADDDVPTMFIAYTIKGHGLPFAGHKDNHSGLMNPAQIATMRASLDIAEGQEWDRLGGLGGNAAAALDGFLRHGMVVWPHAGGNRRIGISAPDHTRDSSDRPHRRPLAWAGPAGRLLAEDARARCRSGVGGDGGHPAGGAGCLGANGR